MPGSLGCDKLPILWLPHRVLHFLDALAELDAHQALRFRHVRDCSCDGDRNVAQVIHMGKKRCARLARRSRPALAWGDGKHTLTKVYMLFMARWARHLSWKLLRPFALPGKGF
jgi:hypothetical protein